LDELVPIVAASALPTQFADDLTRLARFEREAKVLASLSHAHVAGIYGMETLSGARYLVLEYVDGETLAARLRRGALPVDEALAVARQIGEALEAAHEKGIVHRDLKPGNVMLTREGQVKVLDFGLARVADSDPGTNPSASPTLTAMATEAGVILGTAAYMSPEQAKGRTTDRRSDVWAFGCVLYEMLTGHRAFEGDDVSDTLAAVLRAEPDWAALPPAVPAHARGVLRQCLQKERKQRLRDIGDVLLALEGTGAGAAANPERMACSPRAVHLLWFGALLAMCSASVAVTWRLRTPIQPPETRLDITTPKTDDARFALSPDGRQVVFAAPSGRQLMLWVRMLDATIARPLAGTEGAVNPFGDGMVKTVRHVTPGDLPRLGRSPDNVDTVLLEHAIARDDWHAFRQRLRDEQPVERVMMVKGQMLDGRGV
jgi:serine/threonine protein kinase